MFGVYVRLQHIIYKYMFFLECAKWTQSLGSIWFYSIIIYTYILLHIVLYTKCMFSISVYVNIYRVLLVKAKDAPWRRTFLYHHTKHDDDDDDATKWYSQQFFFTSFFLFRWQCVKPLALRYCRRISFWVQISSYIVEQKTHVDIMRQNDFKFHSNYMCVCVV